MLQSFEDGLYYSINHFDDFKDKYPEEIFTTFNSFTYTY